MGMCCGRKSTTAVTETWTVTYPDGTTKTKHTELGAKLAAAGVPGSTYVKTTSSS